MEFKHVPVLLNECLEGLNISPSGFYLDCTLGGAGHSSEIAKRLNKDGILVEDGNIIVKNSSDVTVFDALGLVSAANFASSSVENSSQRDLSTANGVYVDINSTSITTPSFTRNTKLLIFYFIQAHFYLPDGTQIEQADIVLNIDGTNQFNTIFNQRTNGIRMDTSSIFSFDSSQKPLSTAGIITLGSGSHTLKLQAQAYMLGSENLYRITKTSIMYLILGS